MAEAEKTPRRSARKRCAIYTRKWSEEGLEQTFNSLDAQREACAAFILSQKRGLGGGADALRRRRLFRWHDGAAGFEKADRRHRGGPHRRGRRLQEWTG